MMHQRDQRMLARKFSRDIREDTERQAIQYDPALRLDIADSSARAADRVAASGAGNPSPMLRHSDAPAELPEFGDDPPVIRVATGRRIEAPGHREGDPLHHKGAS